MWVHHYMSAWRGITYVLTSGSPSAINIGSVTDLLHTKYMWLSLKTKIFCISARQLKLNGICIIVRSVKISIVCACFKDNIHLLCSSAEISRIIHASLYGSTPVVSPICKLQHVSLLLFHYWLGPSISTTNSRSTVTFLTYLYITRRYQL